MKILAKIQIKKYKERILFPKFCLSLVIINIILALGTFIKVPYAEEPLRSKPVYLMHPHEI